MGAGSSVGHGEQKKRHSVVSKPGQVRKSILLSNDPNMLPRGDVPAGDEALPPVSESGREGLEAEETGNQAPEQLNVNPVLQVQANIFQVQVPHGVPPGGMFSAVCNNRYVKIEIPMDCQPGDFIEIDLSDIDDEPPSALDGFATESPEQKLKRAAALFMKYDTDKNYCITMAQLELMLEKEFNFPPGAEATLREMSYADVDKSHSLSFDEFCHWLEHLQLRLELHRLQDKQRQIDLKTETANREDEERKLKELLDEQAKLRQQTENQMQNFLLEIEVLRKEKERLETFKANYTEDSDEYAELTNFEARNNEKLKKMEQHHRENEAMIEKMKQDYMVLHQQREEEEQAHKEAQRKKVQAKMEERKRLKAQKKEGSSTAVPVAEDEQDDEPDAVPAPSAEYALPDSGRSAADAQPAPGIPVDPEPAPAVKAAAPPQDDEEEKPEPEAADEKGAYDATY